MRKLLASLSLSVAVGAAAWSWSVPPPTVASSHREAPLTSLDPTIDNTDTYAFRSPDTPSTVTLLANWIPAEEPAGGPNFYHFDDNARYLIKVDSDGDGAEDVTYEWTFREAFRNPGTFLYNIGPIDSLDDPDFNYVQFYTVREIIRGGATNVLVRDVLQPPDNIGPRSTPNYERLADQAVYNAPNGIKVFTGQRDDPFYIDLGAIFDLLGLRPFNEAHRIRLPRERGVDTLGGFNIHTTAIQVPIRLLAPTCPVNGAGIPTDPTDRRCVIGVWSTSERRTTTVLANGRETASGDFVQVSRLGNPLVNELVVDLARKDAFNATPPTGDEVVLDRVLNLEIARRIEQLYGIGVPPNPRNDLVTVFLTGIPNLNQQVNSVSAPSEQLRLNTAIAPTAGICGGNVLGVIDNDLAGYPNGRRLEDDAVDITLRVAAGGYALTPNFNRAPNNLLGDGVNMNDRSCVQRFPYMPIPQSGYNHEHDREDSSETPR